MMKKLFVSVGIVSLVAVTGVAFNPTPPSAHAAGCQTGATIFPRWYDGLCESNGNIKQPKPQGNKTEDTQKALGQFIAIIAMNIVSMILVVVGYVSLAFIIYGGIKYITSGDNSAGIAAGKKTIINAVIGLIISIGSVAIVRFVVAAIK